MTGFETQNQYEVKNSIGQKIYHAKEVSSCCSRICCGSFRAFDMKIIDSHGEEVIHLYRPLACSTCWFPCCLQVDSNNHVPLLNSSVINSLLLDDRGNGTAWHAYRLDSSRLDIMQSSLQREGRCWTDSSYYQRTLLHLQLLRTRCQI